MDLTASSVLIAHSTASSTWQFAHPGVASAAVIQPAMTQPPQLPAVELPHDPHHEPIDVLGIGLTGAVLYTAGTMYGRVINRETFYFTHGLSL